jgi:hypothetical protein
MLAQQPGEGMERLDHSSSLRPSASRPGRERHDGDFAGGECAAANLDELGIHSRPGVEDIPGRHILHHGRGGKAILGETNESPPQVVANPLVLGPVEAVIGQQFGEIAGRPLSLCRPTGQHAIEERLHQTVQLRTSARGLCYPVELRAFRGWNRPRILAKPAR